MTILTDFQVGFSTDTHPRSIFPSVVGSPAHPGLMCSDADVYVGCDAQHKRNLLNITHPMQGTAYLIGIYTLIFYKKLAIRKRGLKWQKNKKLQGWTRTDLRNCQIQKNTKML